MRRLIILLIVILVLILIFIAIVKYENIKLFSHLFSPTVKQLPTPAYKSKTSIEEALSHRRSIREYKDEPLTIQQIGQLLWAAQGITSNNGFRTAPSAGALYPLEIYLIIGKVTDMPAGVYHYIPENHSLEKISDGDKRQELDAAANNQESIKAAAVDIVITANYTRTKNKYGERGERFVHLEAGHAAENVCLQSVSLQLGTVTIGAFDDSLVKKILNLTNEDPLYILPVGKI